MGHNFGVEKRPILKDFCCISRAIGEIRPRKGAAAGAVVHNDLYPIFDTAAYGEGKDQAGTGQQTFEDEPATEEED